MRSSPLTLPIHALLELLGGIALIGAAFTLEAGIAATLATFVGGVVLTGLGLGGAEDLAPTAHRALDRLVASSLIVASLGLGLASEREAGLLLLAAGLALAALTTVTRWTRPRPAPSL